MNKKIAKRILCSLTIGLLLFSDLVYPMKLYASGTENYNVGFVGEFLISLKGTSTASGNATMSATAIETDFKDITDVATPFANAATGYSWTTLPTVNTSATYYKITDITTYGKNATCAAARTPTTFDGTFVSTTSRVTYCKKIKVSNNQKISLLGTAADTGSAGSPTSSNQVISYAIDEFDSNGNLLYDSNWLDSSDSWTVGSTVNGYAVPNTTRSNVAYIVIIFKIDTGNDTTGGDLDTTNITPAQINTAFKNLYLILKPFTYTVDANGGTIGSSTTASYSRWGITPLNITAPVRTGYTLSGYTITASSTLTPNWMNGNTYSPSYIGQCLTNGYFYNSLFGNTTLLANWTANSYTIKFEPNGGSGTMSNLSMTYDTAKTLTANAFSKTGYKFSGWNTKADGSGTSYANKASVKNLTSTNGATVTLYAQWTANTYRIYYRANGGSGTMSSLLMTYDTAKALTANTFTKTGYVFSGWNTKADGSGTSYADKETVVNLKTTGSVYLYAQWTPITTSVRFYRNQTTSDTTKVTQSFTYDVENQAFQSTSFIKTGYTLLGWATSRIATEIEYEILNPVTNEWILENHSSINLYGVWKANTYEVSFEPNGGSGTMENQSMTYGTASTLNKNTFTRTGYVFSKWNKNAAGTSTSYSNGASVKNLTSTNGATVKLYAQWTPISYVISFDSNGGSGTMSSVSMKYDTAKALTANAFSKTGYTFSGWNTKADGSGIAYSNQETVKNLTVKNGTNITLYAQWIPIATSVEFYRNQTSADTISVTQTFSYDVKNQTFRATAFTKTGYTLQGWSANRNATESDYEVLNPVTNEWILNNPSSINLYGVWKANTYKVSFEPNGGSGTMSSLTMTYDVAKALTTNAFTKTGYTFSGWNTKADGSGTSYADKTSVKNLTSTNGAIVTLYAQWTANSGTKYTVNHWQQNLDGNADTKNAENYTLKDTDLLTGVTGANVTPDTKTYTGFASPSKQTVIIAADGSLVVNYYYTRKSYTVTLDKGTGISVVSGDGTYLYGQSVTINATVSTGYTWKTWSGTHSTTTQKYTFTMPASNVSNKANATVNTYTIAYNGNGSNGGSTANSIHTYNVAKTLTLNGYTKTGYVFVNWNTKADGSGISYENGQSVSKLTAINNETITLYAQWARLELEVSYNAPTADSGKMSNDVIEYGKSITLKKNTFIKGGWNFNEWNTSLDGTGVKYNEGDTITFNNTDILNGLSYTKKTDDNGMVYTYKMPLFVIWDLKSVSVNLPKTLILDKNGCGSFIISTNLEVGKLKVGMPTSFKLNDVCGIKTNTTANVLIRNLNTTKTNNMLYAEITPNNELIADITCSNLSAGSWNGIFEIDLELELD